MVLAILLDEREILSMMLVIGGSGSRCPSLRISVAALNSSVKASGAAASGISSARRTCLRFLPVLPCAGDDDWGGTADDDDGAKGVADGAGVALATLVTNPRDVATDFMLVINCWICGQNIANMIIRPAIMLLLPKRGAMDCVETGACCGGIGVDWAGG